MCIECKPSISSAVTHLCMSLLLFVDAVHVFDRKSVVLLYAVHGSMFKSLRESHAFTCKTRSPFKYYI